ncbi:hypothetical protein Tco_1020956 [Tanacetum coccineum]
MATPIDFSAFMMNRLKIDHLNQELLTGPTYDLIKGDFQRLRHQDIEDMLLLLVQGKLINLSLDYQYALNVALRMYTRRIVIQGRMEDLQLAVESYHKKINLIRPDTTRPDLRKITPYTGYPDVQGIIYQDELSRNRLMRIDKLHKFSDGILNHVRTTLNDIATGIQMDYLPKRRCSPRDKRRARVMISAIDRKLKDRRLMRSLEKFIGGRPIVIENSQKSDHVLKFYEVLRAVRLRYDTKEKKLESGIMRLRMELTWNKPTGVVMKVLGFYTSVGNPVKQILLKLILPDHRSILTDSKVTPTKHGRMTKPYSPPALLTKSGGLLACIYGLLSGRYCGLVGRVTCGYPWLGLGENHKDFAMPSHFHKKFRWGTIFATGRRSFIEPRTGLRMKKTNRRTRVPIGLYPCHIKEKMTIKDVRGESVMEWKTKVTTKEGIVIQFLRKFRGYKLTTEEEVEENEGLKEVWEKMEYVISDSDSNLKSTASS